MGPVDDFTFLQIAMAVLALAAPVIILWPQIGLGIFPFMALIKTSPVFSNPAALYPVIMLSLLMLVGGVIYFWRRAGGLTMKFDWMWVAVFLFVSWATIPPWIRHAGHLTPQTQLSLRLLFWIVPFSVVIAFLRRGGAESFVLLFRCIMWTGGTLTIVIAIAAVGLLPGMGMFDVFRQNPIPMAWAAGLTLTTLAALRVGSIELSKPERAASLIFMVSAAASLMFLRQRGPAFSAVLTILLISLLARRRFQAAIALLLLALVVATILVASPEASDLAGRFSFSREMGYNMSVGLRANLYLLGWRNFLSHPLTGIGLGEGRSSAHGGYAYVHNIFLEVLSELGLIGLVVFAVVPAVSTVRAIRLIIGRSTIWRDIMLVCFSGFVFYLCCAQTSGNLEMNRGVWWFAALIWAAHSCYSAEGMVSSEQ